MRKGLIIFLCLFFANGCTVYTEKRSQALSQAVFATSDSIDAARFDLADKYSKEATKIAFPPKKKIKISPIFTKFLAKPTVPTVTIEKPVVSILSVKPTISGPRPSNILLTTSETANVLRLVIPEKFKDAQLLIEGSTEWNELMKTKEFSLQLQNDYKKLEKLKSDVDVELAKQSEMNSKMIKDLNILQQKLLKKNLLILQLQITIVSILVIFALCVYLRIKGIL